MLLHFQIVYYYESNVLPCGAKWQAIKTPHSDRLRMQKWF